MSAPVEPKALFGGVTAAVSGAALYLLSKYVFKGTVPDGVASMIYIATPGIVAFVAAYLAPHQVRPGDTPAPAPVQATAALTAASSFTEAQMEAVREALTAPEQGAAGERKVPPP